MLIDQPGVYDLPSRDYFSDPVVGGSLSSTGARKLLDPSCPALFQYDRTHPGEFTTAALDFGIAAHQYALNDPEDRLEILDYPNYQTKVAQTARDAAYAAGKTPILRDREFKRVQEMAAELRKHHVVQQLMDPDTGACEQTIIWQDATTGVWCRARLDWLRDVEAGRRLVVVDYKTSISAAPSSFGRTAVDYKYHCQAAWYLEAVRAIGLDDDPAFVWAVQMKNPPYLTSIVDLDDVDLNIGRNLNRIALNIYAECTATGVWPGFADDHIARAELPGWYRNDHDEAS